MIALSLSFIMIKNIHLLAVSTTILLFIIRYLWMMNDSSLLQKKWVKIVPHVIDSVLLVSAIVLAIQISQYPVTDGWLTAKLLALLLYIVLGTIALKRGKTKVIRVFAGIGAILTFAYMISVAITKSALGFFLLL